MTYIIHSISSNILPLPNEEYRIKGKSKVRDGAELTTTIMSTPWRSATLHLKKCQVILTAINHFILLGRFLLVTVWPYLGIKHHTMSFFSFLLISRENMSFYTFYYTKKCIVSSPYPVPLVRTTRITKAFGYLKRKRYRERGVERESERARVR